jgi:predicted signal transduction protein with EAL and GGDEF domain
VSEVLSRRFSIFPADDRQSLRLGRFLMAAGTSLLVSVALLLFAFLGLLPWRAAIEGTAGIVTLIVLFFVLLRSRLNTDRHGAIAAGERVRAAAEATAFPGVPAGRRITITVGVATHVRGEDITALLARADQALYQGKGAGRNRVVALG